MNLTLVRHGNTNGNRRWLVEGTTDTPLNAAGKYQAEMVAVRLRNEDFDQVCSSDLSRAFDTASAIVRSNYSFNDEKKIERCQALRERHFGIAETTMILQHRENAKRVGFKGRGELTKFVPEGGESDSDVRKRVETFLKYLLECRATLKTPDWKVLIVSHGITMREIVRCLVEDHGCTGIPNELMKNGTSLARTPNTGVWQFSLNINSTNGHVTSGMCTIFQCKRHLESSNALIRKLMDFQKGVIEFLELLLAIFLFLLSKLGL